jgi:hypothetical protein
MKFFVSYSRSMKSEVGAVVKLLRAAGHDVWWDGDIPKIADWWATILTAIEDCDVFIFMISEKSVVSPYCLAELNYAIKRNHPILPFILDDYTTYALPNELGRGQWYQYDGDPGNMLAQVLGDCDKIEWSLYQKRYTQRPAEPNSGSGSLIKQFQQAVTLAEAGQFDQAFERFRNVKSLDPATWGGECERWIACITVYGEVAELADHPVTMKMARQKWSAHLQNDPESATFDPLLILGKVNGAAPPPPAISVVAAPPPPPAFILPAPFAWIDIPGTLGKKWTGAPYKIAKYPVTNAQFRLFVDAKGYTERRWWTEAGWEARAKGWVYDNGWKETGKAWTEPRYWRDSKWNGAEQPVVGVSWYEAVAYCLWLSEMTGEQIMLPTEDQWQYAAQGDDGRTYPWGNDWDCKKCNNSVKPCDSNVTTPVRQFEGKGESFFKVVDMAGNVWEWCLTDYHTQTNDVNSLSERRCVRGGSWGDFNTDYFRCDLRDWNSPHYWFNNGGFRLALS